MKLISFALISVLFSLILGNIIADTFFSPINQFSDAVSSISNRNFSFRTHIKTKNEFGDLGKAFNKTLSNLHELETARIVQENLLPGNQKSTKSLEIFAKTLSMSQVGGDYYDFIELQPNQTSIFLGDVVGHGVSASLLMAMAKAIIIYEKKSKSSPEQVMASIGNMIFELRKKGAKEYMTGQLLTVDNNSNKAFLLNAGHPYPLKISKDGKTSEFLKTGGLPLGFKKNATYCDLSTNLLPGESLILYTDGIVESSNSSGELFGFDRLELMAKNSWHCQPEIFFQNLISIHSKWVKKPQDDISIVVIKRKEI
jgi:sigma-B regulation protein RsbU (phosphoserine phosphatase)